MTTLAILVGLNTVILALHLVEEIKTDFFKKFPLGPIPIPLALVLNVMIYAGALLIIYLAAVGNAVAIPMAWIFGVVMLSNAVLHLLMVAIKRAYFPGAITAVILLPASIWLLLYLKQL